MIFFMNAPIAEHGTFLISESPERGEIYTALVKAWAKIPNAKKNQTNKFYQSRYADLSSVRDSILAPLTENGLIVTQPMGCYIGKLYLVTTLGHTSGQWIRSIVPLRYSDDDKIFGAHLAYMRRYALNSILTLAQLDEDSAPIDSAPIDAKQQQALETMLRNREIDFAKFQPWLIAVIGVETLDQIPQHRFAEVQTAIQSKPVKANDRNKR